MAPLVELQKIEGGAVGIPGFVREQVAIVSERGQRPGIIEIVFHIGGDIKQLAVIAELAADLIVIDVHGGGAERVDFPVHFKEAGGELRAGGVVILIVDEQVGAELFGRLPVQCGAQGQRVLTHQVG